MTDLQTELVPDGGWIAPAAVRLAAPTSSRGFVLGLMARFARRLGRPDLPDVIATLHLNPRLFWPWLLFASRLMPGGRLPARLRELIILRTAWNCRSRYEWGQHVEVGLRVGLTDDEIARVPQGPDAFAGAPEQAALQACDELCAGHSVSEETWRVLAGQHRPRELIELTLLVGHYVMIAGFLNASGLALEPPIEAQLQAFHRRIGRA